MPISTSKISFALLVTSIIFLASCLTRDIHSAEQQKNRTRTNKISPELTALYDEYSAHVASNVPGEFHPRDATVRVIDDRVLIDAVASGDVADLKTDLISLGVKDPVVFGRMISAQLPISAIPAIAKLPSLQFARAAGAATRGDRQVIVPSG